MPHSSIEAKKERMVAHLRHRMPSRRTPMLVLRHLRSRGKPPPDLDFVTDNLAVGGALGSTRQLRALPALGITAVVSMCAESRDDEAELNRLGISFLHLPTPDCCPPAASDLDAGATWVSGKLADGGKVLIHCQRGMGRSVILAAATLLKMDYDWRSALNLIKSKRFGASPLRGQIDALREFAHSQTATRTPS